ncbi:MAG: PAS domain-containing protein, partial [Leptolyngbya sp. SIO1D8]|nr:PAS domain-containing protein [Leptolyngbya sp. SIO1D8]
MKRLYKITDNLLILPLAAMIISLFSVTIFLWTDHDMRTFTIIALAISNAIIMIILFQKMRKRFQLILHAIQALDNQTLVDEQFAKEGGLTGRIIKKLKSIGNKIAEATELIVKIGEGKEIGELRYLQEKDGIRMALTEMQDKITSYNDQERKRNWVVEGVAKFSEILRQNYDNEADMGFAVISNLVRYVDSNQGGFFIANEDENGNPYLELIGSYAYDGRKYQEKIIYPGQGLLGQSMRDKERVYITKVPDHYVSITSGLGEATPRNLIIIPLLLNEEYCGAIELASFEILADYQIGFLEKVAENIAAYVSSLKTNANTQKLLQQSQTLTEELKSREEEMRQNLEELSATQEEMQRKQTELDGVFHAIDTTMGMVELGMDGKVLAINDSLLDIYGFKQKEVVGKYQDVLLGNQKKYDQILSDLQENKSNSGDFKVQSKSGEELWINASFTAVKNKDKKVDKVLMLAQNITAKKKAEKEFEQLSLVADNTDNSVIITDSEGCIEFVNNGFTKLTGYELEESMGKKPGHFLQGEDTDPETVARIGKQLEEGKSIYEEILNYRKTGESYWVSLVINPIFDEDGKVDKFISIQADITETKIKSLDYAYKLEAISRSNAVI